MRAKVIQKPITVGQGWGYRAPSYLKGRRLENLVGLEGSQCPDESPPTGASHSKPSKGCYICKAWKPFVVSSVHGWMG
jgi:hypothetical protein